MNVSRTFRIWGVAAALVLGLSASGAEAGPDLVYEPFNYASGSRLEGLPANGLNLAGKYDTTSLFDNLSIFDNTVLGPGLDYGNLTGNLPGVSGNLLSKQDLIVAGVSSVSLAQDVLINPGQAIYFSALFRFDDAGNGVQRATVAMVDDTTGDELAFGEAAVGVRDIRVSAITTTTGGAVAAGADNAFTDGQVLWLIGRYVNGAAPGGDSLELVGYDTSKSVAVSPTFDIADPNAEFGFSLTGVDIDFTRISSLRFEVRGTDNNFLDEVRISYAYPAAVPEPAGVLLVMVGAVVIAARGRFRRVRAAA
jgi:hypothetical protein